MRWNSIHGQARPGYEIPNTITSNIKGNDETPKSRPPEHTKQEKEREQREGQGPTMYHIPTKASPTPDIVPPGNLDDTEDSLAKKGNTHSMFCCAALTDKHTGTFHTDVTCLLLVQSLEGM